MRLTIGTLVLGGLSVIGMALLSGTANAQLRGERGTAIIVDVSGSMIRTDYASGIDRYTVAKRTLDAYLRRLEAQDPRSKVALLTYGASFSWEEDIKPELRVSNPQQVKPDTKYCQDVIIEEPMQPVTTATFGRFRAKMDQYRPAGMTPIVQAIGKAASLLDPEVGGDIVVISDWEEENCIPEGVTLCEAINDVLEAFDTGGGTVEYRLIFLPDNRSGTSLECRPADTTTIPATQPDPTNPVTALTDQFDITFEPVFTETVVGGRAPMTAASVLAITGPDITGQRKAVYQGAVGLVKLFRGRHDYSIEIEGATLPAAALIVSRDQVVEIPLVPAQVTLQMQSLSGDELPQRAKVVVLDAATGTQVATEQVSGSRTLAFAPGRYRLRVTLDGQNRTQDIFVGLGEAVSYLFAFDALPRQGSGGEPVPTVVDLQIGTPDTFPGYFLRPRVALIAPDGQRRSLATGPQTLDLVPGPYTVRVTENGDDEEWQIEIPAGGRGPAATVLLDVQPGWAWLHHGGDSGTFKITDLAHNVSETITGTEFLGTLPAGQYKVSLRLEGGRQAVDRFRVAPGGGTVRDLR